MSLSSRRLDSDKLRGMDCQIGRRRERRGLTCRRMYIGEGVVSSVTDDDNRCEAIRGSWWYNIPRRYNSWTGCVSIHLPLKYFPTKPLDARRRGEDKIYLSHEVPVHARGRCSRCFRRDASPRSAFPGKDSRRHQSRRRRVSNAPARVPTALFPSLRERELSLPPLWSSNVASSDRSSDEAVAKVGSCLMEVGRRSQERQVFLRSTRFERPICVLLSDESVNPDALSADFGGDWELWCSHCLAPC